VICPNCGMTCKSKAKECPRCGEKLWNKHHYIKKDSERNKVKIITKERR